MDYYGTLGPSCQREEILRELFLSGMTGLRINLSHGGLAGRREEIRAAQRAAREAGTEAKLLIDLEGPEIRIGSLAQPVLLKEGEELRLVRADRVRDHEGIPVPEIVYEALSAGDRLLLDDGKLRAEVTGRRADAVICRVQAGGPLSGRKSLAVEGRSFEAPTLTAHDRENLALAGELGITGVMLPFVRGREDLRCLRRALSEAGLTHVRIFAKIENLAGVEHLEELLDEADEIVIARGDLGNAMPLWKLPGVQKRISAVCREHGTPFMVVTQMLDSMHTRPVPTRAEVLDVYQAVLDGAASVMLTGETAAGAYPAEAMRFLVKTGREAERDRAAV